MIKAIKASKSEKILFIFLICLSIFTFSSFFLLKNKCLFIDNNDLKKLNFENLDNIAVMNLECGNVIIELYPEISPKSVERFKTLIEKRMYDGSAFYKVVENTLVQAGDIEFFITLKEIPIYQGEYTPIGKVKYGLDILKKIKTGNKAIYVLRPDYINTFRMLGTN